MCRLNRLGVHATPASMANRFPRVALFLAAIAIMSPASALADDRPGHGTERVRNVASAYADCIVTRYPSQSVDVLINDLPNSEVMDRYRRLNSSHCMGRANGRDGSGIRFVGDAFRYMLAEGLVRLHYPVAGPTDFAGVPALAREPLPELDEAWLANLGERRQQEERERHSRLVGYRGAAIIGECIARREPESARRLAFTDPAGAEEGTALMALRPALSACIPAGQSLRISRETMRGAILFNYYRLAHAAQPPVIAAAD